MAEQTAHFAALDRILELVVVLNEDMTQSLARDGLTTSRTHLLWELRKRGPVRQRVLAEAMKLSARTVTGLVDGLVDTGFVTRQADPADRRVSLVTFTPHGTQTMAAMAEDQKRFAELLFGDMSQERFDGLVSGLDEVLDKLRSVGVTLKQEAP